ncbi:hypothetical protein [Afipia felis]
MRKLLFVCVASWIGCQPAFAADGCERSREYLLGGMAGDLTMPVASYTNLFKVCSATALMPNVKDAYILKDGGIAVTPKQDTIGATAATLSRFCESNPRATLRFLTKRDLKLSRSILDIVKISSTSATSCKKLKGLD